MALSLWVKRFSAPGMAFASRLDWIADEANLYKRYMQMWQERFPGRILTIRYEDLVRDLETQSRLLAEHCGIAWSEAMLRPDLNRSAVRTASVNQVREKVHTRSVGNWGLLGGQLEVLTGALDPALWPLETGAAVAGGDRR